MQDEKLLPPNPPDAAKPKKGNRISRLIGKVLNQHPMSSQSPSPTTIAVLYGPISSKSLGFGQGGALDSIQSSLRQNREWRRPTRNSSTSLPSLAVQNPRTASAPTSSHATDAPPNLSKADRGKVLDKQETTQELRLLQTTNDSRARHLQHEVDYPRSENPMDDTNVEAGNNCEAKCIDRKAAITDFENNSNTELLQKINRLPNAHDDELHGTNLSNACLEEEIRQLDKYKTEPLGYNNEQMAHIKFPVVTHSQKNAEINSKEDLTVDGLQQQGQELERSATNKDIASIITHCGDQLLDGPQKVGAGCLLVAEKTVMDFDDLRGMLGRLKTLEVTCRKQATQIAILSEKYQKATKDTEKAKALVAEKNSVLTVRNEELAAKRREIQQLKRNNGTIWKERKQLKSENEKLKAQQRKGTIDNLHNLLESEAQSKSFKEENAALKGSVSEKDKEIISLTARLEKSGKELFQTKELLRKQKPLADIGVRTRNRCLEKLKPPQSQDKAIIDAGDLACHSGFPSVDALLYEKSEDGTSTRTDQDTYIGVYGTTPSSILDCSCAMLNDILGWRFWMRGLKYHALSNASFEYVTTADSLVDKAIDAESFQVFFATEEGKESHQLAKEEFLSIRRRYVEFREKRARYIARRGDVNR